MQKTFLLSIVGAAVLGFSACNENEIEDPNKVKNEKLALVVKQYVNYTVIDTYRDLADATIELYDALATLRSEKTQTAVVAATEKWFASRKFWERSEAFLYGAAADFFIDPHIDHWPLDEVAFRAALHDANYIANMDSENGDLWAGEWLVHPLLGFHSIEYIIFENGLPKDISKINENQLIYAKAIAGDLRNQCIRLEAAWAGFDKVSATKQALIEEKKLVISFSHSDFSYGENMINAGLSGSTYRSASRAVSDILTGCIDISDEVGAVKIGTAYNKENVDYIESPYSYNSLTDFVDNIRSIENAYLGGVEGKRGASVSDYIKSVEPSADNAVKAAIANAIAKIGEMSEPFSENYASPKSAAAIAACSELTAALETARTIVEK